MRALDLGDFLERVGQIKLDAKTSFLYVPLPQSLRDKLEEVGRRVLPPGTAARDVDHITLVFNAPMADDVPAEKVERLLRELREVAEATPAIKAKVQGWGYFDGAMDDGVTKTALVALIDAPGLEDLHVEMKSACRRAGFEPSTMHGYVPHATFAYLPRGERIKDLPTIDGEFEIDKVTLANADKHEILLRRSIGQDAAKAAAAVDRCKVCGKPATVKVLWAEGHGYQPACEAHKEQVAAPYKAKDDFSGYKKYSTLQGGVPGRPMEFIPLHEVNDVQMPLASQDGARVEPRDRKGYDVSKGETAPNDGLSQNVAKVGEYGGDEFRLPKDHKAGMRVPKGGSNCSNCAALGEDGATCRSPDFIKWNGGSNKLPAPADEYCSDWYNPASGTMTQKEASLDDLMRKYAEEEIKKKTVKHTISDGKKIVASCYVRPHDKGGVRLSDLFVEPTHRKRGLASRLIEKVKGEHDGPIHLTVDPGAEAHVKHRLTQLYLRHGFKDRGGGKMIWQKSRGK